MSDTTPRARALNIISLEHPQYRAARVRELERRAIQEQGIPGYTLMTRAAAAALRELRARWPRARRIRVVCGAGNNAGDGYVLARLACAAGLDARVGWLGDPATLRGDARTACLEAQAAGVALVPFAVEMCADADCIVDALLGTGLERPVSGEWAAAVFAPTGPPTTKTRSRFRATSTAARAATSISV